MKNNAKKHVIISSLILISFVITPFATKAAGKLNGGNAYKGIVQIITYYEDSNYILSAVGSGSGVIIDENGTILTNEHIVSVTDDFDNQLPVAFTICLTTDVTKEPDCLYSADLIAKDKDKDIALLKIKNIGLNNKTEFDYITRASGDFQAGTAVQALGYPGIGGNTITSATGTIIGTEEEYSLSWIKTDALISFGSSGGALLDSAGNLFGVTSAINGDMGYAININSINSWIDANTNKTPAVSPLQTRMSSLISEQNSLKTENKFTNLKPHIEFTKNTDWEYAHLNENILVVSNPANPNGGTVNLVWIQSDSLTEPAMDVAVRILEEMSFSFSDGTQAIGGKTGIKMITPLHGKEFKQVILPSKNYSITITYYYGEDDIDKTAIDAMINSIKITDVNNDFKVKTEYENQNPYFKLKANNNWTVGAINSSSNPARGQKISNPEFAYDIQIKELTDAMKSMSKDKYFNYVKDDEELKLGIEDAFGYKADRYFLSTDYKVNNELQHEIFYKYRFKDEDENDEIKYYTAGYRIFEDDRVIIIGLNYFGGDENVFENTLKDFQGNVMANFTLGGVAEAQNQTQTQTQTTNNSNNQTQSAKNSFQAITKDIKNDFGRKLAGKIILQVESNGKAWYVSPKTNKAHFLGRPDDAFSVMREQGVGITNADLEKIPVGLSNLSGTDTDKDGLSDIFEDAVGTDKNNTDTDGDGYNDKQELQNSYNPKGAGRMNIDAKFSARQNGRIFLQVEKKGEAWYINPNDGKRYFLGRPQDAYNVMKNAGLGISDSDFGKI